MSEVNIYFINLVFFFLQVNLIQSPLNYCSCLSEIILMTVTSVLGSESRDQMEEERDKDCPPSEANLGKL